VGVAITHKHAVQARGQEWHKQKEKKCKASEKFEKVKQNIWKFI